MCAGFVWFDEMEVGVEERWAKIGKEKRRGGGGGGCEEGEGECCLYSSDCGIVHSTSSCWQALFVPVFNFNCDDSCRFHKEQRNFQWVLVLGCEPVHVPIPL